MALKTKRGKGKWSWWHSKRKVGRESGPDGPQNQTREGKGKLTYYGLCKLLLNNYILIEVEYLSLDIIK